MEFCLETKLKNVVQSNVLVEHLNEMVLNVHGLSVEKSFYIGGITKIVAYDDGYFMLSSGGSHLTEATITDKMHQIFIPANIDFRMGIYSKYSLVLITNNGSDMPLITYNLTDIAYSSSVVMLGFNCVGDTENLKDKPGLLELFLTPGVYGDIVNLQESKSLEKLNISGSKVYGELSTVLNAFVSNGRTSGRIQYVGNGIVTLNGAALQGYYNIKFGTSMVNPTQEDTTRGWQYS